MATKTALAIVAPGTEEMELVITVDVLRRAGVSNLDLYLNLTSKSLNHFEMWIFQIPSKFIESVRIYVRLKWRSVVWTMAQLCARVT